VLYWVNLYPGIIIPKIEKARLLNELDNWLADPNPVKKFLSEEHDSNLESFYSDKTL
jgi:hypothetical protein